MGPPRALEDFAAEANEILDTLGRDLLALDLARGGEADPELLNAVFRAAHSLKGLSGMFGQERMSKLAHRAEDVLDGLRMGKVELSDGLLDTLIETLEVLQALLNEAAQGRASMEQQNRAESMGDRLSKLLSPDVPASEDPLELAGIDASVRAVFTEYEEHRLRENLKKGLGVFTVRAVFSLDDFDTKLAELNASLKPLGEVVSTLPSSRPGDEQSIAFDLIFGSGRPQAEIAAALGEAASVEPLTSKAYVPTPSKVPAPAPSGPAPRPSSPQLSPTPFRAPSMVPSSSNTPVPTTAPESPSLRAVGQTVRVDIGRLDGLMNSIGELLVIRSNLSQLAETARNQALEPMFKSLAQSLTRETRALERKLDELQKGLLEVRMVPLGQVFDKLARLMRRLVRESGKSVEFFVQGGDVELDKLIVDELSDPLMHLLRNALDHGVELPDARRAHGKSGTARITLRAQQQGNHVVIEVADDGAGMNEERIRAVAVERGVITEEQANDLERAELLNLVFLPGFSTRSDVSELSGRGVGLDVVKTNLAKLSGLIDIESSRATGTRFILTLPLTLAIIRALMVRAGDQIYAVPLNSVLEIVTVKPSELRTIERREVLQVRGQTLPFVRLSKLFGLTEQPVDRHYVIIVGLAQQRLGLAVDVLEGQQDIVTKPLGGRLRSIRGFAGATELGDRRAVLVLDVASLIEELVRPAMASEVLQ